MTIEKCYIVRPSSGSEHYEVMTVNIGMAPGIRISHIQASEVNGDRQPPTRYDIEIDQLTAIDLLAALQMAVADAKADEPRYQR